MIRAVVHAFAALAMAGAWAPARAAFDPGKVVFVNETRDHKHDRALRASTRWFQESTGIQVGLVLKERLPANTSIEAYAAELLTRLGLGRATGGKAVLFVWAEAERLFKIEVSYDLEPVFTDVICKRLEDGARTFMLSASPYARRDFIVELNVTMKLHYLEYQRTGRLSEAMLSAPGESLLAGYLSGGAGIVGRGYAATLEQVQRELVALPPELEAALQPAPSPDEAVRRYLRSLDLGIGAPNVPLLTEASRYFRMDKPHGPGYLKRIHGYYTKAMPYRIVQRDDLAAAVFAPGNPVLPIFLRRDDRGLWLVDEPKVWASLHLYQDGSSQLKYADAPYAFAATSYQGRAIFGAKAPVPRLVPLSADLRERIREAEREVQMHPGEVDRYVRLADLIHFEIYWLRAAQSLYERILRMDPGRTEIRWRLVDVYQMTSDIDGQNRQWCELLERDGRDGFASYHYAWFRKSFYWDDARADRCGEVLKRPSP